MPRTRYSRVVSTATPFDVLAYATTTAGSHREALLLDAYDTAPLSADLVDALDYIRRREAETTRWLSVVLVTPTHKEARITAFLSSWAWERHWREDALQAIVERHRPIRAQSGRSAIGGFVDRTAPLRAAIAANVQGPAITAAHMAECLVDGWILDAMLDRAAAIGASPALVADLARLRAIWARQEQFFVETTARLLDESDRIRNFVRRRVASRAWPMGAERDRFAAASAIRTLFGADTAWAATVDARIDTLPGLTGLGLARAASANPGRPRLRIPLRVASTLGRTVASITTRHHEGSRTHEGH
jgi:hypothetical protein